MQTPLRAYITVDDITVKLFNRSELSIRERYVQRANLMYEDLAKRKGVVDLLDLATPTHITGIEYLTQYAVSLYCIDYTDFVNDATTGVDKYATTLSRMEYLMQRSSGLITIATLTGLEETPRSRAVSSARVFHG